MAILVHKHKSLLLVLLLFSLLIRLNFAWLTTHHPAFEIGSLEEASALIPAYSLGWGKGFVLPDGGSNLRLAIKEAEAGREVSPDMVHGPFVANAIHPPGHALVGMFLYRVTEIPVSYVLLIFGSLLGMLSVWLVYLITKHITGSFRLAYLSAVLYALFPPCIRIATNLSNIGPASFLVMVAVWLFLKSLQPNSFAWLYLCLSSCAIGLLGYFRPDWMLLIPVFVLGCVLMGRPFRTYAPRALVMILVQVALMTPWAYRNYLVSGEFHFTTTNTGMTLVSGLGRYPNPWGIIGSDTARHKEARDLGFDGAGSPEANEYFKKKFIMYIKEHPVAYMKILLRRAIFIATPYQWGFETHKRSNDPSSFAYKRAQVGLLRALPTALRERWPQGLSALLMVIALPGVFMLCLKKEHVARGGPILMLVFLYGLFIHILIHIEARYLLPGVFVQLAGLAFLIDKSERPT